MVRRQYKWNVFLSYCRSDPDLCLFFRNILFAAIRSHLALIVDKPLLFSDSEIPVGTAWAEYIAEAHATSRVLVPILCRSFFASSYCRLELELMMQRQQNLQEQSTEARIIYPIVVDDGDTFPDSVRSLQSLALHEHANPMMVRRSHEHARLSRALKPWVTHLYQGIEAAPPHDEVWFERARAAFLSISSGPQERARNDYQKSAPRLGRRMPRAL